MLRFFNTLTRREEEFESLEEGKVRIYTCGPTVWDYSHIGNFRAMVFADVLKRYLRYRGYEVFHVLNITDIEDKILRRLGEGGIGLKELTEKYTEKFFEDLHSINVERADVHPRATEHIEEMLQLIASLIDKGLAYERDGSVYYAIDKFADYGKLAHLDMEGMQDGISVDSDEYDKDSVRDFALWKAWVESDGEIYWDSPYGRGRPGWHIECSAMSMKYLGQTFDIHTGGVDLIFPHHQNEIAQSEGATGKPFVRYWMHNEFLNIDNEKMSKSKGNYYRLQDIAQRPEDFKAYRYLLVSHQYRRKMNYMPESLDWARTNLRRLNRFKEQLEQVETEQGSDWTEQIEVARNGFCEYMDNDLNSPGAMGVVFGLINEAEKALNAQGMGSTGARALLGFLEEINQVLGIFYDLEEEVQAPAELPEELQALLQERQEARDQKDWVRSDQLRDQLVKAGIQIKDASGGTEWSWIE
jgi:cysteinyl-tRNA synthetase